ncbi:unnamed protein product [Auanema sp. JU1783]|nr:unnamed protein product [Auanema sp. JU1783]
MNYMLSEFHLFLLSDKFYCDIHGRQKKDLIGAAGQTPLHPHTAVQAPLTSIRPNQTHANAGSFYQPDNLSRPAPQSINTHHITVNVTNPKTQGPISPAQRGIPTNSVFTGDRTTTTKSSSSSSEHFRNSSQPSSYNLNTTNNVPNLPVQAPPPLPQTELHVNVNDRKTNLLSPSRSNESRIPLSVRDAVSPRSVKSPRQWPPPHNLSTNRYWIIDPVGKAKAEKTSVTLQDLIKNEELELHLDDLLEEKSLKTLFSPLTGTNGNAVEPRIENGIHWTVISGPVKHNFRSTSSCEANDRNCEDNQFSNPDEKRSHNTLKCNESECSETQHSSNVDIPQIQLTRADLESSVNENQITESQTSLKVISRQDSSTSPIPVIKFERNASGRGRVPFNSDFQMDFSKTIKVVTEDQLSTNYDNPTFVLNSSPHPYDSSRIGGAGEKRVEFKSSANFVNSEKRWSESNHIVDESDILTDNSRRSDESIDDSNIESRLTAAPYDGDVSEFGKSANTTIEDEQEEWMREEVEQAKQEQIEENASSAAISMRVNNIQSEEVSERGHSLRGIVEDRCIGEDDQRQRDLAIVAALHDRIHDIREMEDQDRLRAIECIERHQQDLEDQQDQLSLLLNSAIQYLRTFDTPETVETRVLNELKTSSDFDGDSKPLIDYPPLPPARSNKSPPAPPERRCFKVLSPSFDSSNIGIEEIITRSNFTNTAKEVASDRLITQLSNKLKAYDDTAVSSFHNNEFQNQSTTKSIYPSSKIGNGNLSQQHTGGRTAFCEACKQHIRGAFVLASGLSWCPEHFICANNNCGRRLLECGFVEEGGHKYCECCFEAYIAPKCSKCTKPIISDCLNALQKKWHPTCFTCTHCQKPFGNNAFYLENGQAFCEADWNMLFTTKCVNCKFAIEAGDRWVEALGSAFHSNCFNCSRCMINLEGESFFAKNGEPFCKLHA